MTTAKDPYRYFRVEARELVDGLVRGVLELEKGAVGKEPIAGLLRLAHTLKGAARIVKQPAIAELAHSIEETLGQHRDGGAPGVPRVDELLRMLDGIAAGLKSLDADDGERPRAPAKAEPFETVRVELGEMDALLHGLAESGVQLTALRRQVSRLDEPLQRSLGGAVGQVERELLQARDTADRLRLLPASVVFGMLERAARDAAQSLDRRVELRASGGEHRFEAHVLSRLSEALLHAVRNAVAHGIEPAAERAAAGKPPAGVVELLVERRGGRFAFCCRDDGRGIDVEAVRRVAIRRGLVGVSEARSLGLEQAVKLLLRGGVSTTEVADMTSGRGVGLDAVRAVMAELRGEVAVHSEPGAGTTVELSVPISLSSLTALQVAAGGLTVSIPLAAVVRVLRVETEEIARSDARASIDRQGQAIPLLPLWRALRRPQPGKRGKSACVVLVRSEQLLTAVLVERLLGAVEVVVRPLPAAPVDPIVAGASLDADGNPCLLLDPAGIALAARTEQPALAEPAVALRPPVLVVDDSLTTRMLEQSILESAGYEVELATSGEEALDKARARRFGLFLVDVEMPGIDGFEFIERARADPLLRETPAMLVTSRGSTDDRRRGERAGARGYILKSEFDQSRLVQTIRELIG